MRRTAGSPVAPHRRWKEASCACAQALLRDLMAWVNRTLLSRLADRTTGLCCHTQVGRRSLGDSFPPPAALAGPSSGQSRCRAAADHQDAVTALAHHARTTVPRVGSSRPGRLLLRPCVCLASLPLCCGAQQQGSQIPPTRSPRLVGEGSACGAACAGAPPADGPGATAAVARRRPGCVSAGAGGSGGGRRRRRGA